MVLGLELSRLARSVEKLWILWADKGEVKRLRKLRRARSRGILGYPPEVTTPKRRAECN